MSDLHRFVKADYARTALNAKAVVPVEPVESIWWCSTHEVGQTYERIWWDDVFDFFVCAFKSEYDVSGECAPVEMFLFPKEADDE